MKKIISAIVIFFAVFNLFAFPNSQLMNTKVGSIPKDLNESVFTDPKAKLEPLVKSLLNGVSENSMKVRIIHDWICNNIAYDTDMYFSGRVSKQDYVSVLKKKKGVCSGYCSVFNEMCRLAGVESIGISGYSKGFGYSGKLGNQPDHEWNAVKIGNNWKLVDCCWDAGYVEVRTFVKKYSTEWFFLSPEKMLYSHLPEKDEYQFVKEEKLKTKEQFVKEPYIPGKFFNYGFELTDIIPDYTTVITGETVYTLKLSKNGVSTSTALLEKSSQREIENALWIDRKGNSFTYYFDVPDKNNYKAVIFAKNNSDLNYHDKYSIAEFESDILPRAQSIIASSPVAGKTISQNDFDLFKNSFTKCQENDCYYYKENLFATKRINAVKNVFKALKIQSGFLEPVLDFEIKAADDYEGFGHVDKYPNVYTGYNSTKNTTLITPKIAKLTAGETYTFEFDSKDYLGMALNFGEDLIPMSKNGTNYKIESEIPADCEQVTIYGSKNGRNYEGLIYYDVEK